MKQEMLKHALDVHSQGFKCASAPSQTPGGASCRRINVSAVPADTSGARALPPPPPLLPLAPLWLLVPLLLRSSA